MSISNSDSDSEIEEVDGPLKCGFGALCNGDGILNNPWGNDPEPLQNYCKIDDPKVCETCYKNLVMKARLCKDNGEKYNMCAVGGRYIIL